jgi:hypothetical protein
VLNYIPSTGQLREFYLPTTFKKGYICFMSKKEQILRMIIKVVDKNAPDSEVYLYGSQARGNAKKLSDWD